MRDEIISGLKNAMERGSSLEDAAKTFINAGYNKSEVDEAVSLLSTGATNLITNSNYPENKKTEEKIDSQGKMESSNQKLSVPQANNSSFSQQQNVQEKSSGKTALIVLLVLVLLVLIGGIILMLLFKENLIELIGKITG